VDSPAAATIPSPAEASPTASDPNETARLLQELTQAVRKYGLEQQQAPKTLEELVAQGYLAQVPQAPSGKKFAIDKKLQVYLASE
jgi:hypothetical protein